MASKTKARVGKVIAAAANPGSVRSSSRTAPISRKSKAALRKKGRASFDPKTFLTRVGDGRSLAKYRKGQIVFSQGEVGDAVFYIQKGEAKVTVEMCIRDRGQCPIPDILLDFAQQED